MGRISCEPCPVVIVIDPHSPGIINDVPDPKGRPTFPPFVPSPPPVPPPVPPPPTLAPPNNWWPNPNPNPGGDPGDPLPAGPIPLDGAGHRFMTEGWVPDPMFNFAFNVGDSTHTIPGPRIIDKDLTGWVADYNLFDYKFVGYPALANDLSSIESKLFVDSETKINNENLKSTIKKVINDLLELSIFNKINYNPSGAEGGFRKPIQKDPYNEELFYLMKNNYFLLKSSLSDKAQQFLDTYDHRCPSTYFFKKKYREAMHKAILLGKFEEYFPDGKIDSIIESLNSFYFTRKIPELVRVGEKVTELNLEVAKNFILEQRIPIRFKLNAEDYSNNVLRQYWKYIPSEIDLRSRIYRLDGSICPIAANDDDSFTVHRVDTDTCRPKAINAEFLSVFCAEGRHQLPLLSNKEDMYIFDVTDKSVVMGLLTQEVSGSVSGAVSGAVSGVLSGAVSGPAPTIELETSTPFSAELEFKGGITPETEEWPNFYLASLDIAGTDTLTPTLTANPYIKNTEVQYKIVATEMSESTEKDIDRAIRYISGPANVFFVSNDDPLVYHLNYLKTNNLNITATISDLNINGIINGSDKYFSRVPAHILIVPSDDPVKNPFLGKSQIFKILDTDEGDGIVRKLRFIPSPTFNELNSTYMSLIQEANDTLSYTKQDIDEYPLSPQGNLPDPLKLSFAAANTQTAFNVWKSGSEVGRPVDPVRKVFDFLTETSFYYDTRTDITSGITRAPTLKDDPIYPVTSDKSLPLIDVWRYLSRFEFYEFLISFKDSMFQELASSKFRGIQLFNIRRPEVTYLHKYDPATATWDNESTYGGTTNNLRNALGIDFIESRVFMDKAKRDS